MRERRGHLERMIARLRRRRIEETRELGQLTAREFRAVASERLRHLERQIDEVKGRVNGLIFLLAGTVAAELVRRLVVG